MQLNAAQMGECEIREELAHELQSIFPLPYINGKPMEKNVKHEMEQVFVQISIRASISQTIDGHGYLLGEYIIRDHAKTTKRPPVSTLNASLVSPVLTVAHVRTSPKGRSKCTSTKSSEFFAEEHGAPSLPWQTCLATS